MENNEKKTCLIYCRVSDQDQLKGMSLEVQEDLCRKWADTNRYVVKGVYVDEAKSGTKVAGRESFEDALIHCQREHIDAILVIDTDRFARNEEDHFAAKAFLNKLSTKIIAVNQPMIDESPEGKLMETMLIGINAFYSRITGRKVKKSLENKWEKGWWPGWAPLGYINVNIGTEDSPIRIVQIDPEKGPIIRWTFEKYSTGNYSYLKLMKILARKGLRTKNGKPIAHSTLQQILSNTFYWGWMKWNGMEKMGNHEPLIKKKLFDLCQLVAARHRNFVIRERKYDYLLRGLVYCARCGLRYTAEPHPAHSEKRETIHYYHCQKRKPCKAPYVEVDDLEKQVYEQLKNIRFSKGFTNVLTNKIRKYLKGIDKGDVKIRRAYLNKRATWLNKRKVLEDRLMDETVDRATFKRNHDEVEVEIDNIDSELAELGLNRKFDFDLLEEALSLTRNIPKTYKEAPQFLKRQYLNFFFNAIEVDNKKVVNTAYSPLITELINQQEVILRKNWLR